MNKKFIILAGLVIMSLSSFYSYPAFFTTLSFSDDKIKKLKLLKIPDEKKIRYPKNKKPQKNQVELGKALFFEKVLSRNKNISCATCHDPNLGFGDANKVSLGTHGNKLTRNTPPLYNLAWNKTFFLDGRSNSLEEQLEAVLTNEAEMDMTFEEAIKRLKDIPYYKEEFNIIYPKQGISQKSITHAITSFERSLIIKETKFDRFLAGKTNLNQQEINGLKLFLGKANCISCHKGPNLTDGEFHNIGVETNDIGRQAIDRVGVKNEFEMTPYPFFATHKAFKTPGLRNVANTAPYFHDGSAASLEDVIENYDQGGLGTDRTGIAKEIRPIGLNKREKEEIIAFLHSLSQNLVIENPL